MQKIRINNDIAISWGILTDGEKKSLEGRAIEVEISNTKGYSIKPAVTIQGNTLVFGFKGVEQTSLGVYQVKATDTTNGAMHTIDVAHAFELVPHSCAEDCECRCVKGIEIKYVELTSCMPSILEYKTINGESILGQGDIDTSENLVLEKHTDLLYGVKYGALDYEFAKEYFKTHYAPIVGGCSVVRKGNKIGRNLDWYYNNEVEFIIETDAGLNRHASKGFVGTISALTKDVVAQGIKGDLAKVLPFRMTDGLNDAGLYASVNIVNPNATRSIADDGTTPAIEERDEICISMLVRYILDNFSSAQEAYEYIRDYVRVYAPVSEGKKNEGQIYIADKVYTYVLSFEGTQIRINTGVNVLTNFRLYNTRLINSRYDIERSNIEDYGQGIERANIALGMLPTANIEDIMHALHYTSAYEENSAWLTEFAGIEGATIHDADKLRDIQRRARDKYLATTRDKGDIWHTTHSVIYDLDATTAEYKTQEINDGNSTSGTLDINKQIKGLEDFKDKFFISDISFSLVDGNIDVYATPQAIKEAFDAIIKEQIVLIRDSISGVEPYIVTNTSMTYGEMSFVHQGRYCVIKFSPDATSLTASSMKIGDGAITDLFFFSGLRLNEENDQIEGTEEDIIYAYEQMSNGKSPIIKCTYRGEKYTILTSLCVQSSYTDFSFIHREKVYNVSLSPLGVSTECTPLDKVFYSDLMLVGDAEVHGTTQAIEEAYNAVNNDKVLMIRCEGYSNGACFATSFCYLEERPMFSFIHRNYLYECTFFIGTTGATPPYLETTRKEIIADAPKDGKMYVRQNGAWVELNV